MRQNFSPHKHSFQDAPHKHSFLFIAHKRVVVYLYFEVKTTPHSGVISKKKKKGHRQHRGQDNHNDRDDAVDLLFLEITSEMAKILRLSPDAAKIR